MKVAILSFFDFEEVPGGSELSVSYLKKAFPDSDVITYSSTRKAANGPSADRLNLREIRMGVLSATSSTALTGRPATI